MMQRKYQIAGIVCDGLKSDFKIKFESPNAAVT